MMNVNQIVYFKSYIRESSSVTRSQKVRSCGNVSTEPNFGLHDFGKLSHAEKLVCESEPALRAISNKHCHKLAVNLHHNFVTFRPGYQIMIKSDTLSRLKLGKLLVKNTFLAHP